MNNENVTNAAVKRLEEAIAFLGLNVKVQTHSNGEDSFIELAEEGRDNKPYGTGLEIYITWDYRVNILKEKIGEPVPFYTACLSTLSLGGRWHPPEADVEDLCESTTALEHVIPVLLAKYVELTLSAKYGAEDDAKYVDED